MNGRDTASGTIPASASGIRHMAISASAGSGKTYQLSNRLLGLLIQGVPVDRIVALTFSRKAAGEIFDMVMRRLTAAAGSPRAAEALGRDAGADSFDQDEARALLRGLLDQLHRLHISTIDSFTLGVVRAFPLELGIAPDITVMDANGSEARAARRDVLRDIFSGRHVSRADQDRFLQAYQQSTYGHEDKGIERTLDEMLSEYQHLIQAIPEPEAWGVPQVIWPRGIPWLEAPAADAPARVESFRRFVETSSWPPTVRTRWLTFVDLAMAYRPGSAWDSPLGFLENMIPALSDLREGEAVVRSGHTKCALDQEPCLAVLDVIHNVVQTQIVSALEQTQGMYRVLRLFESVYDEQVRRRGQLTFDDAQFLLTPMNPRRPGMLLSSKLGEPDRLYIDFRLDHQFDHWLIDEFQDTSDLQWAVLRNLIDEVIQDTDGRRSFFYVGDVKQAIYSWRGGNSRLFRDIRRQYGRAIEEKPLDRSFRSCQTVIDTVNSLFGTLPEPLLQPGAAREWKEIWSPHEVEPDHVPKEGYIALLEPSSRGGQTKPTAEDRYQLVADLLRELDPLSRGLSVAILVLRNSVGRDIVDFIRDACPHIPVAHEGRSSITDHPVVAVLLSLVRFAAHPGDTTASEHVRMTPLAAVLRERGMTLADTPMHLLREIHLHGFRGLLWSWGRALLDATPNDAFGRKRCRDLVGAAAEFDSTGDRSCDRFLDFIEHYRLHESAAERAVRVMTVHQSKGLGFDVVVLPDLMGQGGGSRAYAMCGGGSVDLVVSREGGERGSPWVLRMPNRTVAGCDAVLSEQLRVRDETDSFDALCTLYVATTRARRAMYIVTSFAGASSKARDMAAFVKMQLAGPAQATGGEVVNLAGAETTCLYQAGSPDWYLRCREEEALEEIEIAEAEARPAAHASKRIAYTSVSPSGIDKAARNAGDLFSNERRERFDFGTAVHELFERVSWLDETDEDMVVSGWIADRPHDNEFLERVTMHFRNAIRSPDVRDLLSRPGGVVDLWRERRFEVILDRDWVSGVFDRVVIERNAEGNPVRADIFDYKTDHLEGEEDVARAAAAYRGQLQTYRAALSRFLGLTPDEIGLFFVFTGPGRVVELSG